MNDAPLAPETIVYVVLAGVIPSLIWLWFWLREDNLQPEPRWLLVATFFGGVLSVIAALFVEKFISDMVTDFPMRYLLWAAAEEILKFTAVAMIALHSRHNDEPIDAMIYCIVTALGFAAIENTLFIFGPLTGGQIAQGIVTDSMRFIGATLVHIVSSATVGFALGFTFYRGRIAKFIALILGLSAAIALHAGFNLSIMNATTIETLKTFTWVWAAVVILIILFEEIKSIRPRRL